MKHCPKCNTTHNKDGIFCSRSCASSRPSSDEKRLKQSNSAKNSSKVLIENASRKIDKLKKECTICNASFYVLPCNSNRKTCSKNCKSQQVALSNKGKTGGYREGSGRSNSGYYKGIYCGSTYELVWVIYRLDHNLSVTRFSGFIPYDNKKYFPDFIDGNIIYEMKGYHTEAVDAKIAGATALRL